MSFTYAIGDIQGCYTALQRLLETLHFDEAKDTLWLTGDLVNRGPESLAVLRFAKSLGEHCRVVLGNHDLHLLAIAHGVRQTNHHDTFHDVLTAPDRDELMSWLLHRPLLVTDDQLRFVMTHAGIASGWTLPQAMAFARELESALQTDPKNVLAELFGNTPDAWSNDLTGAARLRCITNYLTRMRYCHADGRLDFSYKGKLEDCPPSLTPWFHLPTHLNPEWQIVFGHWAALQGQTHHPTIHALDTGCAWGESLTALCLETGERRFVPCSPKQT